MKLAYIMTGERGATDLLLSHFARTCLDRGLPVSGLVQINTEIEGAHHCDMDVQVLPDGPVLRISQSLGTGARGCRLDSAVLETAVGLVEKTLATRPALVILNKFGKQEAEGGGFRELIGTCLAEDIPVVTGVNRLNYPGFEAFSAGLATRLAATEAALDDWLRATLDTGIRVA